MIKSEDIDRLPTSVREAIKQHLEQCMANADKVRSEAAMAYALSADETQRSVALTAQGEYTAFSMMYNIFK